MNVFWYSKSSDFTIVWCSAPHLVELPQAECGGGRCLTDIFKKKKKNWGCSLDFQFSSVWYFQAHSHPVLPPGVHHAPGPAPRAAWPTRSASIVTPWGPIPSSLGSQASRCKTSPPSCLAATTSHPASPPTCMVSHITGGWWFKPTTVGSSSSILISTLTLTLTLIKALRWWGTPPRLPCRRLRLSWYGRHSSCLTQRAPRTMTSASFPLPTFPTTTSRSCHNRTLTGTSSSRSEMAEAESVRWLRLVTIRGSGPVNLIVGWSSVIWTSAHRQGCWWSMQEVWAAGVDQRWWGHLYQVS